MAVCEHHQDLAEDLKYIRRKVSEMDSFLRGAPDGRADQPGIAVRLIQHEARIRELELNAFPWRRVCLAILLAALLSSGVVTGGLYALRTVQQPTPNEQVDGG